MRDPESVAPRILVAGIGNRLRGDDGFGPRVVDLLLSQKLPAGVEARDFGLAGLIIATELSEYDIAIFLDSAKFEGKPGSLQRSRLKVEAGIDDPAELARLTLHEVGLEGLLKFSKSIGTLPERIYLIGCKPKILVPTLELSPEVKSAVEEAASMVMDTLGKLLSES
ncbi:MAG: hydrogenase maturation protease [Candidatus Bathyarchaeota archaeon]|nr:hydrogenase maturation protease [Candidatus Bathyarchaeota archaeon]